MKENTQTHLDTAHSLIFVGIKFHGFHNQNICVGC